MRRFTRAALILGALAAAPRLAGQEPKPAHLLSSSLAQPDGVSLGLAWRFEPGDAPGREATGHDDAAWRPVKSELEPGAFPTDWSGAGWFRRHLEVDPELHRRVLALRIVTPGVADVWLDGKLVLSMGGGGAPPEIPRERRDSRLVTLEGREHVLAVRYAYPPGAPRPTGRAGFLVSIADPGPSAASPGERPWLTGLQGAIAALPVFLVFLHLALFAFDTRARVNLFYAVEMAAFAVIVLNEFGDKLLATDRQREILGRVGQGAPIVAVLFGLLTYYAVRTDSMPRTWRAFTAAGLVLAAGTYALPGLSGFAWPVYFAAIVVEIVRLEGSGRVVERQGAGFFLRSFAILGLTIVLQVLVNFGVLGPVAGVRAVYIFGILVSAVGMSLFLARSLGQARVHEAENARRTLELARAREVQLSMLPRELPAAPGFDLAAETYTAAEVGGDYYDARATGDGSLLVAFGDATGHGLASSLVVTAAKALFMSLPASGPLPDMLSGCDRILSTMRFQGLQMCLALGRLTPRSATIASAGMPPLLVCRSTTGEVFEVGTGGLPLGSPLRARYVEKAAALEPGDTLLFASDGFAELRNPGDRELGYPGVAAAFAEAAKSATAREVVERLGAAATAFRGTRPPDDDVTFLVVRVA